MTRAGDRLALVLFTDDDSSATMLNPADRPTRQRVAATAAVVLAFLIPAAVLIASGIERTAAAADQNEYHLPTIRQFARQWPAVDLSSYPAAMTPGYHLLMTAVVKLGGDVGSMRWATLLITAGLVGTLAWAASGRRMGTWDVVLLCLPFAWSQYILPSGVYVVPHTLSWWGLLLVLVLAIDCRWSGRSAVVGGILLSATVMVRQIYIWAAAPLVAAAMTAAPSGGGGRASAFKRALIAGLCCVPAAALLFYFYKLWGSLAPSSQPWAKPAQGVNLAAITMILATFGLLAPLAIARLPVGPKQWLAALAGVAVGLVHSLIGPTTYSFADGRWSGLWNLAALLGTAGERSVLITILAGLGGGCVGLLLAMCRPWFVWGAAIAGFIASNAAVNLAWPRYYEPMVLMTCVLIVRDQGGTRTSHRVARGALCLMQAGLTVWAFRNG
ncbi:hypothetical protein [Humisphaera borealis]|uniref:Uncharacterized protein n=1 Tax=Humisphaera borealis TaxID=2807512 RepID=A0A7M2X493_9BACT|nr:hypothetical protein [Humisphaera borealis]QOV91861.1 hypothetical protein IPV69_11105 [Humisphaera borealis]